VAKAPPLYEYTFFAIKKHDETWEVEEEILYRRTDEDFRKLLEITVPEYGWGPSRKRVLSAAEDWIREKTLDEIHDRADRRVVRELEKELGKEIIIFEEYLNGILEDIKREGDYDVKILVVVWQRPPRGKGGVIAKKDWWMHLYPDRLLRTELMKHEVERLEKLREINPRRYEEEYSRLIDNVLRNIKGYYTVKVARKELKPFAQVTFIPIEHRVSIEELGGLSDDIRQLTAATKEMIEAHKKLSRLLEASRTGVTPVLEERLIDALRELISASKKAEGVMPAATIEAKIAGISKEEFCESLRKSKENIRKRLVRGEFLKVMREKWLEIRAIDPWDLKEHKEWIPLVERIGYAIEFPPPAELRKLYEEGSSPGGSLSYSTDLTGVLKKLVDIKQLKQEEIEEIWRKALERLPKGARVKICETLMEEIKKRSMRIKEISARAHFIEAFSNFVRRKDIPMEEVEPGWARYFRKIAEYVDMEVPVKLRFSPSKDPAEQRAYEVTKEFLMNLLDRFSATVVGEDYERVLEDLLNLDYAEKETLEYELSILEDQYSKYCSEIKVEVEEVEIPPKVMAYCNELIDELIKKSYGDVDVAFERVQGIIGYSIDDYEADLVTYRELEETYRKLCF